MSKKVLEIVLSTEDETLLSSSIALRNVAYSFFFSINAPIPYGTSANFW